MRRHNEVCMSPRLLRIVLASLLFLVMGVDIKVLGAEPGVGSAAWADAGRRFGAEDASLIDVSKLSDNRTKPLLRVRHFPGVG